jgi:prevent-host-death family protein
MDARTTEFAAAEAKARFSELLDRAEAGEEITIRRHGKAVAKITPIASIDRVGRAERHAAFLQWRSGHVTAAKGRIDYKSLIDEGRR